MYVLLSSTVPVCTHVSSHEGIVSRLLLIGFTDQYFSVRCVLLHARYYSVYLI